MEKKTVDRVEENAQAREEERILRDREVIAEMAGLPAEELPQKDGREA